MYIYQTTPNLKYIGVLCFSEHYTKPKTATDSSNLEVSQSFAKTQFHTHHSVDKKHFFFYVKFETIFAISFIKKKLVQGKVDRVFHYWFFSIKLTWAHLHDNRPWFPKAKL